MPDLVAVLGVDNDELLCSLCDPPLASVALNSEQVGYEAAELLDAIMSGGRAPADVPPDRSGRSSCDNPATCWESTTRK